jgi:hypothetical protein
VLLSGSPVDLRKYWDGLGDAGEGTDRHAGLLDELADQGLFLGLVAVDGAAGQVEIAALAPVDADAGQFRRHGRPGRTPWGAEA